MKAKGREVGEYGFKKPNDGWHIVEFGDGVDMLKDKDGAIVKDAQSRNLWKFPAKIVDETADDNGADISQIIAESPAGEQKIADIMMAIGEFANFEKAFPGDRSFFEDAIISKVKAKVPGHLVKIKTETSKDGKYTNTVAISNVKYVEPAGKETKKAGKGTTTPVSDAASSTVAPAPGAAVGGDW